MVYSVQVTSTAVMQNARFALLYNILYLPTIIVALATELGGVHSLALSHKSASPGQCLYLH